MSMPEILPIREHESSRLSERVGGRYLTPEWQSTAVDIDESKKVDLLEKYPKLPAHAVANSENERQFVQFYDYPDFFRDREGFINRRRQHQLLYLNLGGMHGMSEERERSFKLLADTTGMLAVDTVGRPEGAADSKGAWLHRLRANILQEVGEHTNNSTLLKQAVDINKGIVENPKISWLEPYKIHAAFSHLDIADSFLDVEGMNESLGLPETANQIIVDHYKTLIRVATENLKLFESNADLEDRISDPVGTVSELVSLGQLRRRLVKRRRSKDTFARQAYLHEDQGVRYWPNQYEVYDMPRTGFDIALVDRRTGKLQKFEIKKTYKSWHGRTENMPDVELFAIHRENSAERSLKTDFLQEVRNVSAILAHNWRQRDANLTAGENRHVERIHSRLDFDKSIKEFRGRVGRAALQALG